MSMPVPVCRRCGSPYRGNPCWWEAPPRAKGNSPPCEIDRDNEESAARLLFARRSFGLLFSIFLASGAACLWVQFGR